VKAGRNQAVSGGLSIYSGVGYTKNTGDPFAGGANIVVGSVDVFWGLANLVNGYSYGEPYIPNPKQDFFDRIPRLP